MIMRGSSLLILLLLVLPLSADVFVLKDRTRLEGRVIRETDDSIVIESYKRGPVTIARDRIRSWKKLASRLDEYDEQETPDTADGWYKLGTWCKRKKLIWRAEQAWKKAIDLDADHKKARKALKHRKVGKKWLTEEQFYEALGFVKKDGRWVKLSTTSKEIKMTVAVKPNADKKFLEGLKKRMKDAAEKWWQCTEGQMYISTIHIVDRTDKGDVVIHNLDSSRWLPGKEYGRVQGTEVFLGGLFPLVTFCHELGHRWFGLPEEYIAPKCASCVMEPWKGIYAFCDKTNHTGRGGDCWSAILKRYPKWKHPNKFGKVPPVKITIEDK